MSTVEGREFLACRGMVWIQGLEGSRRGAEEIPVITGGARIWWIGGGSVRSRERSEQLLIRLAGILGIGTGRQKVPEVENLPDSPRIPSAQCRQTAQGDPRVLNCAGILCVYPRKISALKRIYIWWPLLLS